MRRRFLECWVLALLAFLMTGTVGAAQGEIAGHIEALQDPEWSVRRDAVAALGQVGRGNPEVISALTGALDDEVWYVRWAAARALGQMGRDGVPGLIKALQDERKEVRLSAANGLGGLGADARDAVSALAAALRDEDNAVVAAAANALGRIGPEAREAILELTLLIGETDLSVAWAARRALTSIGPPAEELKRIVEETDGDADQRLRACTALGFVDASPETVSALITCLRDDDPRLREAGARTLRRLGQEANDAVPALVAALEDRDEVVRAAAGSALKAIGADLEPATSRRVSMLAQYDYLRQQVNNGVRVLLDWQLYGPEWDRAVAASHVPGIVTGAVPFGGMGYTPGLTKEEWKQRLYGSAVIHQNLAPMNALAVYALAYRGPWSEYYQDEEMIYRVVKGLDFYRIAQGGDGGFSDVWNWQWVGGPRRLQRTGGVLEGFGLMGLGDAFLLLHKEIEARGLLDEEIDEDDNENTPMVTRREAYTRLFEGMVNRLSGDGSGHAANQDLADAIAFWQANEALKILAPERAWSDEKALERVYSATGILPSIKGRETYWVSRKGLVMEPHGDMNGGWDASYSTQSVDMLVRLAELTQDPAIEEVAKKALSTRALFYSPTRCGLFVESEIGWRTPGPNRAHHPVNPYAALEWGDPVAIRFAQLYLDQENVYNITLTSGGGVHYIGQVRGAIDLLEDLQQLHDLPPTDYRLPMEEGEPDFAWADEMGATVVVRHGDVRLYASLNWQHGFAGGVRSRSAAVANNIARVHYWDGQTSRVETIPMESPHGFGELYLARYADYFIGMNASTERTYEISVPTDHQRGMDLVSGEEYDFQTGIRIPPETTVVFYLGDE